MTTDERIAEIGTWTIRLRTAKTLIGEAICCDALRLLGLSDEQIRAVRHLPPVDRDTL